MAHICNFCSSGNIVIGYLKDRDSETVFLCYSCFIKKAKKGEIPEGAIVYDRLKEGKHPTCSTCSNVSACSKAAEIEQPTRRYGYDGYESVSIDVEYCSLHPDAF